MLEFGRKSTITPSHCKSRKTNGVHVVRIIWTQNIYNWDQTFFYKLTVWVRLRIFRKFLTDKTRLHNIFSFQFFLKNNNLPT
jgi:hypothetical protein